jgi:hypothetical protein
MSSLPVHKVVLLGALILFKAVLLPNIGAALSAFNWEASPMASTCGDCTCDGCCKKSWTGSCQCYSC